MLAIRFHYAFMECTRKSPQYDKHYDYNALVINKVILIQCPAVISTVNQVACTSTSFFHLQHKCTTAFIIKGSGTGTRF